MKTESPPRLPTVGEIARRFGTTSDRITYVIDSRRIKPIGRAGNANVYAEADVEYIGHELRRIARERGLAYA